ncbi:MAG: hypothetical protein HRU35_07330 [Rickettsiaceae bacterium]|nr:hypothetical protein [Rickettsiaceae bacterium]
MYEIIFLILVIVILVSVLLGGIIYFLNSSDTMKETLEIVNQNKKAVNYFGKPIKKNGFLGNLNYSQTMDEATISANFKAIGSRKKGIIEIEFRKVRNEIFVDKFLIYPEFDQTAIKIVNNVSYKNH